MATKKSYTVKPAPSATPSDAFFEIPLEMIIVESQIRSGIDQEGEEFLALVESIREKGVLEPIIVTPWEGQYQLISGERRLLACKKLELPTIPARVIEGVAARDEVLSLQLIENLQRAELDPIDEANALLSYFQARHEGIELDDITNRLVTFDRDPQRVEQEVAFTVNAIQKISGKSISSLRRAYSLLNLPEEIQNALREGAIGVSQGYIFAANLDHPRLRDIFQKAIGEGFTNSELDKELKRGQKPATTPAVRKRPFSQYRRSVQSLRTGIEEQVEAFKKSDLEALLTDLRDLIALVEGRLPEAIDESSPKAKTLA